MTITEFLTARYDEDEAVARDAADFEVEDFTWAAVDYWCASNEAHGSRWKPERVLADIAAKRRLVELCATWRAEEERHVAGRDAMSIAARTQAITAETVLRSLAQPFADHSDFDPAWRA